MIRHSRQCRCDVIELNHRYDEFGMHCFDQIIAWQWNDQHRRHDVAGWWLVDTTTINNLPAKSGNIWKVRSKSCNGDPLTVIAPVYRETFTDFDPERENQRLRPEALRTGLR